MKGHKYFVGAMLASAMLSGCGGGGGSKGGGSNAGDSVGGNGGNGAASSPSSLGTNAAQGFYVGKLANGYAHRTFVLDNGQYYTIYGPDVGGIFAVSGLLQGSGQANNGSFTSTDLKDFYSIRAQVISGSLNASYTPGGNFNATVNEGSIGMTFTGTADSPWLKYNSPASLADIIGAWSLGTLWGFGGTRDRVALNIANDGAFTGTHGGCSFNGTIAGRVSGKNVFDVTINYGAPPCSPPNRSGYGIAFTYHAGNGRRQLTFAGVDGPRQFGILMYGDR